MYSPLGPAVQNANSSNFHGFLGNNFHLHKFDASGFAIESEAVAYSSHKQNYLNPNSNSHGNYTALIKQISLFDTALVRTNT